MNPKTYAHHLPDATAVVHTLGTLLEDAKYKTALKDSNLVALLGVAVSDLFSSESSNPLREPIKEGGYEQMNRDAGACRNCLYIQCTPAMLTHPVLGF